MGNPVLALRGTGENVVLWRDVAGGRELQEQLWDQQQQQTACRHPSQHRQHFTCCSDSPHVSLHYTAALIPVPLNSSNYSDSINDY